MEKKERNKRIGIIAAMVALIILIMCLGGNTFAKYISSKEVPTTSATVAKWGYTVKADATNLFGDAYNNNSKVAHVDVTTPPTATGAAGVAVNANAKGSLLVAPGTTGNVLFGVSGSAEVASQITLSATSTKDVTLTVDTEVYHPLKWTLKAESATTAGTYDVDVADPDDASKKLENLDLATMVTKINKLVKSTDIVNPQTKVSHSYKLTWVWDFEPTAIPSGESETDLTKYKNKINAYDTLLGEAAAGVTTLKYNNGTTDITCTATYEVDLAITVSVAQVQNNTNT